MHAAPWEMPCRFASVSGCLHMEKAADGSIRKVYGRSVICHRSGIYSIYILYQSQVSRYSGWPLRSASSLQHACRLRDLQNPDRMLSSRQICLVSFFPWRSTGILLRKAGHEDVQAALRLCGIAYRSLAYCARSLLMAQLGRYGRSV